MVVELLGTVVSLAERKIKHRRFWCSSWLSAARLRTLVSRRIDENRRALYVVSTVIAAALVAVGVSQLCSPIELTLSAPAAVEARRLGIGRCWACAS